MKATVLPIRLELRDLRLLATIAEAGSLTLATRKLHLTQSTLSYRVNELERRLGFAVLQRQGRGIVITVEAGRLIDAGAALLRSADSLEEWIRETRGTPRRTVRLAAECYTTYSWLPPAMRQLRRRWRDATVIPVAEWTRDPIKGVMQGDIDVAIVADPPDVAQFTSAALWSDRFVLVTAVDHPLAARKRVTPDALASEHLVVYDAVPRQSWVIGRILAEAGVQPQRVTEVPLTEGMLAMVESGNAVAVLARWAVADAIAARRVAAIDIRSPFATRRWHAVYREVSPVNELVVALIGALQGG